MVEMFRPPARTKGKPNANIAYLEAPTDGWNYKAQTKVQEGRYAIVADNVIIDVDRVRSRPGYEEWNDIGVPGQTMMVFSDIAEDQSNLVIAASGTKLYDVTNQGVVTELELAGGPITFTSGYWSYVQFTNLSENFLLCVNGTDGLHSIDASGTIIAETVTDGSAGAGGFDASAFDGITVFKNRVYMAQKGTQNVWYLDPYSKSGIANLIDNQTIFRRGGEVQNIIPWTHDGGEGLDDHLVVITTGGEVAVWKGIDPASTTSGISFELVGVFVVDKPLGHNCVIKYGGDLIVLTETGPVAVDNLLTYGSASVLPEKSDSDDVIRDYFRKIAIQNRPMEGWQLVKYQYQSLIVINVPNTDGTFEQIVKSVVTHAWSRFINLNGTSFVEVDDHLYFCDVAGKINKVGDVNSDNNNPIPIEVQWSWSYYETPIQKHFKQVRTFIVSDTQPNFSVDMQVDFDPKRTLSAPQVTETSEGDFWPNDNTPGSGPDTYWGTADWGTAIQSYEIWSGLSTIGTVGSLIFRTSVLGSSVAITGAQVMYEEGGPL